MRLIFLLAAEARGLRFGLGLGVGLGLGLGAAGAMQHRRHEPRYRSEPRYTSPQPCSASVSGS